MRLDKYLAEASIGVKNEVRGFVNSGRISVNGVITFESALDIDSSSDIICFDEKEVIHKGKVYYMFHKPGDCITARKDEYKKTVLDYFPEKDRLGLFPVGRLDMDTEGLLFLTNDGDFDHMLMYPEKHVDKTYFFWAFGELNSEKINQLQSGIAIYDDEDVLTKPASIEVECEGLFDELRDKMNIEAYLHKKKNLYNQKVVSGYITITEGKKHQVKRMLKAMGCYVVYLKRISIGPIKLDDKLEKGKYRPLSEIEYLELKKNSHIE